MKYNDAFSAFNRLNKAFAAASSRQNILFTIGRHQDNTSEFRIVVRSPKALDIETQGKILGEVAAVCTPDAGDVSFEQRSLPRFAGFSNK